MRTMGQMLELTAGGEMSVFRDFTPSPHLLTLWTGVKGGGSGSLSLDFGVNHLSGF